MSDLQALSSVALSSLRDGVMAIDAHGTILVVNDAAGAILGLSPDQALGARLADALRGIAHADAFMDVVDDAIRRDQARIQQHIQIQSEGGRRTIEVTTSRLTAAEGQGGLSGVVVLMRDVTEVWELAVKQTELSIELEESNQQLQKAVRELEEKTDHLSEALGRIKSLRVAGIIFFVVLIAAFGWYSSGLGLMPAPASETEAAAAEAAAVPARTYTVQEGDVVRALRLTGVLEPTIRVNVTVPISGRVLARRFAPGDAVKEGDVLLEVQDDTLESRLRTTEIAAMRARARIKELQNWPSGPEMQEAQRNLTLAELSLNEQRKTLEEAQSLFAKDIVPEQEVNAARSALQRAELAFQTTKQSVEQTAARASEDALREARLEAESADADLRRLQEDATRRLVRAPIAGLLLLASTTGGQARLPAPGDQVSAGDPMFVVGNTASFTVSLKVDELEIRRLQIGQPAAVTLDALPGVELIGGVINVAGQASFDGPAPYFQVKVGLEDIPEEARGALLLGMSATVEITTAKREGVVTIPVEALQGDEGDQFVWVDAGSPGAPPVKRPVTVGLTDNAIVEVTSGLKADETIRY